MREGAVLFARVPKAAINEDCNTRARENKIWLPKKGKTSSPASHFVSPKQFDEREFRALVAEPLNTRHYLRSLRSREYIDHS